MKKFLIAILVTCSLSACKKSKNTTTPTQGQETITSVRLNITDSNGVTQIFNYKRQFPFSEDSAGTVHADTITLAQNAIYHLTVQVLNESVSSVVDVTPEIIAEKDDHLFEYYDNHSGGQFAITIESLSLDNLQKNFGQEADIFTHVIGTGSLHVILYHDKEHLKSTYYADALAIFPIVVQ